MPGLRARLLGLRRSSSQPREELEARRRQLRLAQPPARNLAQRRHRRSFTKPLPESGLAAPHGLRQPLAFDLDDAGGGVKIASGMKRSIGKVQSITEREAKRPLSLPVRKIGCIGKI